MRGSSVLFLGSLLLVLVAIGQEQRGGRLLLINDVWAVVGDRVVTSRDVMRFMSERTRGDLMKARNQIQVTMEEIKAAKAEGKSDEVNRLNGVLTNLKIVEGKITSQAAMKLDEIINDQLLIEQVKLAEDFREPPGLVEFQLKRKIQEKIQGQQSPKPGQGMAELLREQLQRGITMAEYRRELLDKWILREVKREIVQSITISPKQVSDYYRANYAQNENEQFDVVDLYIVRVSRAPAAKQKQKLDLDQMAANIKSPKDFMLLRAQMGKSGDGPQGLWRQSDEDQAESLDSGGKDVRRMGILDGTPKLPSPMALEDRSQVSKLVVRLLLKQAHDNIDEGKTVVFSPPGSPDIFVMFVNRKLSNYSVSLENKRLEIQSILLEAAFGEARRRRIAKARKRVHTINYLTLKVSNERCTFLSGSVCHLSVTIFYSYSSVR